MERSNKSIHFWIAHGFIILTALGGVMVFALMPILFQRADAPISGTDGVVAGVSAAYGQEPLIQYPSLVPTQEYDAFDTANVSAESFVVMDLKTGEILASKNPETPRSLASLTKLVTALLLVERGLENSSAVVDPQTIFRNVSRYDIPFDIDDAVSRIRLGIKEEFNANDLLKATLIASANDAAFALVESQGLDPMTFRDLARNYFSAHGYAHTAILEPSGLDFRNSSTALEYASLAQRALAYLEIRDVIEAAQATITGIATSNTYRVQTTNTLLDKNESIIGGKTGYLDAAGYTFLALARHESGREMLIVLLGSQSATSRIEDTERILLWLNDNIGKMGSRS